MIGIGERPADWLDDEVTRLADPLRAGAVGRRRGPPHRHRATHPGPRVGRPPRGDDRGARDGRRARARGVPIPGTSVHTTYLCRDKPAMKEALRAAGVPVPARPRRPLGDDVRAFVAEVGFPLVVKPAAAPAHRAPSAVDSPDELEEAIARSGVDHGAEVAVEEFVEGHEGFYDTITIDGHVAMDFVTHYYPNVLEAMRTRWISPQFVTTNRIDAPDYDEVKEIGRRVIGALGIGTSATHMEWFAGPEGPLLLRDRLSAAGRSLPGISTPPPTTSTSTASGPTRSSTGTSTTHRHGASPPGSSRCGPTGTAPSPATRASTTSSSATASGSSTPTFRRRARPPSRSRPATWPTRGCACATRTTTGVREMLDDVGRTVQVRAS